MLTPALLLSLALARPVVAQEPPTLGVLTCNVFGLPRPLLRDPSRFGRMGDLLGADDGVQVVALQEMFARATRRIVQHALFPYAVSAEEGAFPRLSSGLAVLSRWPLLRVDQGRYRGCEGMDCLSRKGHQIVDVQLPGVLGSFLLVNTHLNFAGSDDLRVRQVEQVVGAVQVRREGRPLVLMGDFNFDPGSPPYLALVDALGLHDAWQVSVFRDPTAGPGYTYDPDVNRFAVGDRPRRLDHVFWSDGDRLKLDLLDARVVFTETGPRDHPLSDHWGMRATFRVLGGRE